MRTSILRPLLLLLIVLLPSAAFAQHSEEEREGENPQKRREFYFHVRSYPFGRIPQDARLEAIYSATASVPTFAEKSGGLHALNEWRLIGPSDVGGRINSIALHPTDGKTLYVGAASGGVWKSTDRGASWRPIMDFENAIWVGAVAIDPVNPDNVYVGTGDPNPSNGDSYPGAGIMKSTDAGASWRPVGLTNVGAISAIAIDPRNPSIIIVGGVTNNAGIYRSVDAGATWTRVSSEPVSNIQMNPVNPDQLWIGSMTNGVLRSNDLGMTWEQVNNGLANGGSTKQRMSVAVCEGTPSTLYALAHEKVGTADVSRIYRTNDGGNSWSLVFDSRTTGNNFLGNAAQSQGWYNNTIAVKSDDPNVAIAAGVSMVRSANGGSSWTSMGGNVHPDHHAFAVDPTNSQVIYNGNDGGMYRSDDGGASFRDINEGLAINQFYAIAADQSQPDQNYGGTQDNGTFSVKTTGARRIAGGDGFYVVVDHSNPNIIYGEYPDGDLWKIDLTNAQPQDINTGLFGNAQWSAPITMDPVDANILYHGRQQVFATVDGGENWAAISPKVAGSVSAIAVSRANRDVIYAGSNRGSLIVSTDGGANWNDYTFTSGLPNRYVADFAPALRSEGTAFVAFGGFYSGHIFKTTNHGANWTDVSSNLPDIPVNALAIHPDDDNVIYAGTDIGVFVTVDGGATWASYMNGLPRTEVIDMEVQRSTRQLRIATYGRSMWAIDLEKAVAPPSITAPIGGEIMVVASLQTIGWAGFDGPVNIDYSTDDGLTWTPVAQNVAGSFMRWSVPNTPTMWARVRASLASNPSVNATSFSFTIEPLRVGGIISQQSKAVIAYGLAYDGEFLYTADFAGQKMLKMRASTLETVASYELQYQGKTGDSSTFTDLAYNPNTGTLFVHRLKPGGVGGGWLYELTREGQQVHRWESPASYPIGLAWMGQDNPDLQYLLATDRDGDQNLYLIDPASGEAVITMTRERKLELGPRGATSVGDGDFFQIMTDFTGGSLNSATAELMGVEDQTTKCSVPIISHGTIVNARGIEYDPGDKNIWVTDLSGNIFKMVTCEGMVVPTSAPENPVAGSISLLQNSPNPFRGETQLGFTLATNAHARLVVHDASGRLVATLADGELEAGPHRVRFAPADLASGVYRYTLIVDGRESQTRTMVYVR
jgi:photosystem II stability/assembly factor-like uncharacterized protein